uniref:Uncharacterized protein n=1 Tax=Pyrodinium bahamense TaxID=73915 RepID=A0A7S0AHI7_9DINO|mmetsp:Transcript_34393/g.95092  ORF Transcript_34393/g.95092 Transcript_34393/m.95092 type:complete len:548 (+) Transcript_34393:45-1688(+)|eukprot:CAMPEP_0179040618 /NCGR_PEP_ID=MMETSP0796-20121207/15738_1 /TAXON_ID=73915 /ORGANISM="Pyrodinium bahamense, Strain pbaha01" /LENGTH=547 /DNA_ID=CAMNT_0020736965 /DNA_START=39 /DNA_END=1682 /DNA_ORIENTATION=-
MPACKLPCPKGGETTGQGGGADRYQPLDSPGGLAEQSRHLCGLGTACGACFEQTEDHAANDNWRHVGNGQGGFEKVEVMSYVGDGAGSYENTEARSPGWRQRGICFTLLAIGIIALVVYFTNLDAAGLSVQPPAPAPDPGAQQTTPAPARAADLSVQRMRGVPSAATGLTSGAEVLRHGGRRFNCSHQVKEQWSFAKRVECCYQPGVVCNASVASLPPLTQPPGGNVVITASSRQTARTAAYDCVAGLSNWRRGWSPRKKDYCCRHYGEVCPEGPRAQAEGSCDALCVLDGRSRSCKARIQEAAGRDLQEAAACAAAHRRVLRECSSCSSCTRRAAGCSEPLSVPASPADSAAATTNSRPLYDCEAGWYDWEHDWDEDKKEWCCKNGHRGCTKAQAPGQVATAPGGVPVAGGRTSQPVSKASARLYDCFAKDLPEWPATWVQAKRGYCCKFYHLDYCPKEALVAPLAGRASARPSVLPAGPAALAPAPAGRAPAAPAAPQRPPGSSPPFDCMAGRSRWVIGWSEAKKEYCCKVYSFGCSMTTLAPDG